MISVVVAAWNGSSYIEEQLDSIAQQTRSVDEIVIRDDASTDNTVEVVKRWMQKHPRINVRLIEGSENKGYKENFKILLSQAKGDWIFLSDQDDRWHPDKVQVMMDIAESQPELSALASSFTFMNAQGMTYTIPLEEGKANNNLVLWPVEKDSITRIPMKKFMEHNYFQGCSMVLSRDVVQEYLEKYTDVLAHDWVLAIMAASRNGMYFYNHSLFDYRIHDHNTTGIPQAGGRPSVLEWFKTYWDSEYYRTAVLEETAISTRLIGQLYPQYMDTESSQMLEFCEKAVKAIKERKVIPYFSLFVHPGRKQTEDWLTFILSGLFIVKNWNDRFKKNRTPEK